MLKFKNPQDTTEGDTKDTKRFTAFDNLVYHGKIFNIVFMTTLASALAATVIGLLAIWGFYTNWFTIIVMLALIAAPIIVFIAMYTSTDIRTAYYKTWRDIFHGYLDRRKVLKQFARTYNIKHWRKKIHKIEVDGRWHFHADTNYIRKMSTEQEFNLAQIYQEYCEKDLSIRKRIISEKDNLNYQTINKDEYEEYQAEADGLLRQAKSAGEIYVQRRNLRSKIHASKNAEQEVKIVEARIKKLEEERKNLWQQCQEIFHLTEGIYQTRYRKYTESAVKKINRINELRYDIIELPTSTQYINKAKENYENF